jgi:hypothetical protein
VRFAYADPPYLGCSNLYPEHPDSVHFDDPEAHHLLMATMEAEYDGWALSASSPSLGVLLAGAPEGTRIGAWVKPFAAFKRNVRVAYTWEPVLFHRISARRPDEPVGRDHVSCPITLKKGLTGAKPEAFCLWLLNVLGWMPGDEMIDLFPGTGVMGRVVATAEAGAPVTTAAVRVAVGEDAP